MRGPRPTSGNRPPDRAVEGRFTALLTAHAPDVLAYLERRTDPVEDAADVLNETLAVAWRRSDDLPDDDVRARMWLFTTARNVLANHRRSRRRADALTMRLRAEIAAHHRDLPGDVGDPLADVVSEAIRQLPTAQQEVVTLVHWDGFSLAEVAEIVGVSASTVRSRYASARADLASRLQARSTAPPAVPPIAPTGALGK